MILRLGEEQTEGTQPLSRLRSAPPGLEEVINQRLLEAADSESHQGLCSLGMTSFQNPPFRSRQCSTSVTILCATSFSALLCKGRKSH